MKLYTTYEEPLQGRVFTENQMKEVYRDLANKEEYKTFEDWLFDMLKSGVFEEVKETPQEAFENNMKKLNALNAIKNAMVLCGTLEEHEKPFDEKEILEWCENLEKEIKNNFK